MNPKRFEVSGHSHQVVSITEACNLYPEAYYATFSTTGRRTPRRCRIRGAAAPCQKLNPILEEIAEERGDHLKVVKSDTEANPDLVVTHAVRAAPTLVIFSDGVEWWRVVGFRPKPRLDAEIEQLLGKTPESTPSNTSTASKFAGSAYPGRSRPGRLSWSEVETPR